MNILLCKFIDALIQTDTNVADRTRVANIIENVRTAKTMTQVCREIDHHSNLLDILSSDDVLLSGVINNVLLFKFSLWKTCSSRLTLKKPSSCQNTKTTLIL